MEWNNSFKPPWWLRSPHLQTMWPTLTRRDISLNLRRERWDLPDGDFLDLDWVGEGTGPIVVLLHGINGDIHSPYLKGILRAIEQSGWRGVVMYFRGRSGTPNRLPRYYHSGDTEDLNYLVTKLQASEPETLFAGIGVSLGANVLIKWLGETGEKNPLSCAIAISVPFELSKAAIRINSGFSRFYQWYLLRELCTMVKQKNDLFPLPIALNDLDKVRTFVEYDNKITAPLHGFKDAQDYYTKASSRQYVPMIARPTLILQAKDDPFLSPDAIPTPDELPAHVHLELTENGGHVGFVTADVPWRAKYWIEDRIIAYLLDFFDKKSE